VANNRADGAVAVFWTRTGSREWINDPAQAAWALEGQSVLAGQPPAYDSSSSTSSEGGTLLSEYDGVVVGSTTQRGTDLWAGTLVRTCSITTVLQGEGY